VNAIAALLILQITSQGNITLDRAAKAAESFWDQLSAVQCVERVTQARLKENGKTAVSRTTEFDYVALLKPKADGVAVEESRVPRTSDPQDKTEQLLLTSGFPALMLLFHPDFKDKFDFHEDPDPAGPRGIARVAFKSKPEQRSMSALKLGGRFYPILWQGFAWIEESTGTVVRIVATLETPMEDVGLTELKAEVEYRRVALRDTGKTYNLPARVTVTARTEKRQWRNVHDFTGYKMFTVTSSTREGNGKP